MTRKHFDLLAEVLREAQAQATCEAERRGINLVLFELLRRLKGTNPRFDLDRFTRRALLS